MKEIKEICGFEDSKGIFHHTREEAENANERARRFALIKAFTDTILEEKDLWFIDPYAVRCILRHLAEHPDKWAGFQQLYNSPYIIPEIPLTVITKRKWYQIF